MEKHIGVEKVDKDRNEEEGCDINSETVD